MKNLGLEFNNHINLRVSDTEYKALVTIADSLHISISAAIRLIIDSYITNLNRSD